MRNNNEKVKLLRQLEEAQTWYNKYEDSSRKVIMVDESVLDQAKEISKILDTDVEEIFKLTAYRILKGRDLH